MARKHDAAENRPFADLGERLKKAAVVLPESPSPSRQTHGFEVGGKPAAQASAKNRRMPSDREQDRLFRQAMADVCRLKGPSLAERGAPPDVEPECPAPPPGKAAESTARLAKLVHSGFGFAVADTPEYMEGTGYRIPPELAHQLHRGRFAIQSYVDLHGFGASEAHHRLDRFFERARRRGDKAVLIVHGRGRSSPRRPVLKSMVRRWLATTAVKKWILAYASARSVDGGAGATVVLLRNRPLSRRQRKRNAYLKLPT